MPVLCLRAAKERVVRMNHTDEEILDFVEEHDVKFVRLSFCDLFGVQKNIAIMADCLPRAFAQGISFDGSAAAGFGSVECSDLFLVPDSSSVAILPWRPSHERVMRMYCAVKRPDGTDFEGDSRYILKQAVERAADMGCLCRVGTECEFYLFRKDEREMPTLTPFDHGTYGDIAPLDRCENIRREICLSLEEMGMSPESSHHERGPGQNEVDFCYSDALTAADHFITFKAAAKAIAMQNGLFASFMPKPLPGQIGNGMHINLSLLKNGKNLFQIEPHHSENAESFIQGILERTAEITAFLNPLPNSYERLGEMEAPGYVTWSHQNRSQLIRIPAVQNGENTRMELRSPDPACNPYLAFALLIHAGLDGIEKGLKLVPPCNQNLYEAQEYIRDHRLQRLPRTLAEALTLAESSELVRRVLPERTAGLYLQKKRVEWEQYLQAEDKAQFAYQNTFLFV